jgi:hypothetical protein
MKLRLTPTKVSEAVAIALLLVGTFVGKFHEAFVSHEICAEHGEITEHSGDVAQRRLAAECSSNAPQIGDASESHEAAHKHCGLAWFGRVQELLVVPLSVAPLPPSEPKGEALRKTACARQSVPLLLLAPKQSPPAIG